MIVIQFTAVANSGPFTRCVTIAVFFCLFVCCCCKNVKFSHSAWEIASKCYFTIAISMFFITKSGILSSLNLKYIVLKAIQHGHISQKYKKVQSKTVADAVLQLNVSIHYVNKNPSLTLSQSVKGPYHCKNILKFHMTKKEVEIFMYMLEVDIRTQNCCFRIGSQMVYQKNYP